MQRRDFGKPRACKHIRLWKDVLLVTFSHPVTQHLLLLQGVQSQHIHVCISMCVFELVGARLHTRVHRGAGTSRCSHPPGKCWLPPSLELRRKLNNASHKSSYRYKTHSLLISFTHSRMAVTFSHAFWLKSLPDAPSVHSCVS